MYISSTISEARQEFPGDDEANVWPVVLRVSGAQIEL